MSIYRDSARFGDELCAFNPNLMTRNGILRIVALLFLLYVSATWVKAGDKPTTLHPELRAAALVSFTFKPDATEKTAATAVPDKPLPTEDSEILELEKVEVTDTYLNPGLESAVKQTAEAQPDTQRKLGTGVFGKNLGKVRMKAITVLYIPVLVGFSW